jgi:hypothetical protein
MPGVFRGILATFVLAAAMPTAGFAQPADDSGREEAREHFERGVGLMENENWDAALFEFERSLEIHPTRSALFNAGQCLKALHRYVNAIELLQRWMERHAGTAPAEETATVTAALQEMQQYVGELSVTVAVPGAQVLLDGGVLGTAPLDGPVAVDAGRHVLEATSEGYVPARTEVLVPGSERLEVTLALEPVPAPVEPRTPDVPPIDRTPASTPDVPLVGAPTGEDSGLDAAGFWSTASTAVALGIGAAVTGGLTVAAEDDLLAAKERCDGGDRTACADGPGLIDSYDTLRWTTNGLIFGAAALAVTATILAFFTDFGFGDGEAAVTLEPTTPDADGRPTGAVLGVCLSY